MKMSWVSIVGLIFSIIGTAMLFFGNKISSNQSNQKILAAIKETNEKIDSAKTPSENPNTKNNKLNEIQKGFSKSVEGYVEATNDKKIFSVIEKIAYGNDDECSNAVKKMEIDYIDILNQNHLEKIYDLLHKNIREFNEVNLVRLLLYKRSTPGDKYFTEIFQSRGLEGENIHFALQYFTKNNFRDYFHVIKEYILNAKIPEDAFSNVCNYLTNAVYHSPSVEVVANDEFMIRKMDKVKLKAIYDDWNQKMSHMEKSKKYWDNSAFSNYVKD